MNDQQQTVSGPAGDHAARVRESILIPVCLVLVRIEFAAALVGFASLRASPWSFQACFLGALLIDALNGLARRRLVRAAPYVVRAQELSRALFNVAAVYTLWAVNPGVFEGQGAMAPVLIALILLRHAAEVAKFGRVVWRRTQGVTLWRGLLTLAFMAAFRLPDPERWVAFTIYAGIAVHLEALLVSLVVRCHAHTVPSLWHALRDDSCECHTQGGMVT